MRLRSCFVYCLLAVLGSINGATAQTLMEKLTQEDAAQLLADAREKGDIVRGAILFHQGNINCAKCHLGSAEHDRLGPDLNRIDPQATVADVVESILQPSKTIKKGFETVVVEQTDGRVVSGVVVAENDQHLVIRDSQNLDRLLTVNRADVEVLRQGKLSSMPANLADQLKDRQQFLDLLRYVLDIRERGSEGTVAVTTTTNRRELSPELEGLVLVQERNCAACHATDSIASPVAPKRAPSLKWSAKHLNPEFLQSFIADPLHLKPGATMPHLLGQLDDQGRREAAGAIVHFLLSQTGNEYHPASVEAAAAVRGREVFHTVGCVACHSPRDEQAVEQPLADSIPLGDVSQKYDLNALVSFLENPLLVRPSGHMPDMRLTHREATDVSSFLLQAASVRQANWIVDEDLARRGRELFGQYRCANCHDDFGLGESARVKDIALAQGDLQKGCLAESPGPSPQWDFSDAEREQIRSAVTTAPLQLSESQQAEVVLRSFNCIACHARGDLGGITSERKSFFQTTNQNLGDQGRIPPALTGVGAKLQPKWLRDVLVNHRTVRPYMLTRMPQFGEANLGQLPALFEATDHLESTTLGSIADPQTAVKKGLELAGNRGLNCVACHTFQYQPSDTMPAADLTEMAERLEKDWFYQYLLNPQKFSPNTVMPSFWPHGKAIRRDIEGKPEDQIEALWQYLLDGRQARAPSGVVQEPLPIVVTDEARMLRRQYPGVGKRGIGVGYPGHLNLVFDAEQMRLAAVWKGGFVDAVGVWTGQGSGNARPLGQAIEFGKGPDLDLQQTPWLVDDGRPPLHHFRGYSLDEKRRPTLRYSFDAITVDDYFAEKIDDSGQANVLHRVITLTSPTARSGLRFRVGSAAEIVKADDASFALGSRLWVRLNQETEPAIVDEAEGKRLEVPFDLQPNQSLKLEWDYEWK